MNSELKILRVICCCIMLAIAAFSCTTNQKTVTPKYNIRYTLVERAYVEDNDTTYVTEMQFEPIASATDIQSAFFNNFGEWDAKYEGKYNPRIEQIIWERCKLLGTDEEFYIITDGEESGTEYFSAVMVFDQNGNDLLKESSPLRGALTERLIVLMKNKGPHRNL